MADQHILDDLLTPDVPDAELMRVLFTHYRSYHSTDGDSLEYGGEGDSFALRLAFKKHRISTIQAGPSLDERDLATIRHRVEYEIRRSSGIKVATRVLFAPSLVQGYFRCDEDFQICPAPPDAPRPSFLFAQDHPFLLHFKYSGSVDPGIDELRQSSRARELELMLVGLLGIPIHHQSTFVRHHWVRPLGSHSVAYCQDDYGYDGMPTTRETPADFPETGDAGEIVAIPPGKLREFTKVSSDRNFVVPSNLVELVSFFRSLDEVDRDRFLRACYWFQHAHNVYLDSQSASFTALVSAIEALLPDQEDFGRCSGCQRPLGAGPTARFRNFIDRLAPPGDLDSQRNRDQFYRIRSKLSHGSALLHRDRDPGLFGGVETWHDWENLDGVYQVVETSIVRWLVSQGSRKIQKNP